MFENLSFDESCKRQLERCIERGTLPHAVILEGANGETRTAAANELARALVCTGEKKPCGSCRACKKALSGNHPDIFTLKKDDSATAIKVDDIRRLRERATLLPNDGERSVFIINGAQDMNPQAQNALLKIFEEPAKHVAFILTCPSKAAFLDTIVSRASAFMLSQEEALAPDSEGNEAAFELSQKLAKALCSGDEFDFLKETSVFFKDKELFKAVLPFLILLFRDALVGDGAASSQSESTKRLRLAFSQKNLLDLIEETKKLIEATERSANHNLTITRLCSVLFKIKNS